MPPTLPELPLDPERIRRATLLLRAVHHPLRQRILLQLAAGHPQNVTDLLLALRSEQSIVSHHLSILRDEQLVTTERRGKFIYYSLDRERTEGVLQLIDRLAG